MPRTKGSKNRNYPVLTLEEAQEVPRAIQDGASGMEVGRLNLADLMNRSPQSSVFVDLLLSSRAYGLTNGGARAPTFDPIVLRTASSTSSRMLKPWASSGV